MTAFCQHPEFKKAVNKSFLKTISLSLENFRVIVESHTNDEILRADVMSDVSEIVSNLKTMLLRSQSFRKMLMENPLWEFRKYADRLTIPYFVIPGNHDHRENFREAFKDKKYIDPKNEFIQYVIDDYPVRLIGLDTLVPNEMHGELCSTRLGWLEDTLKKETEKPTVIFMHHPPFNSGLSFMDLINCKNGDKLAEIVASQTNIERILCGHVHRHITVEWAGTVGIVAPSAAVQLALELNEVPPENIVPWAAHEQPAFMLHHWDENNGIISHVNHVCATN